MGRALFLAAVLVAAALAGCFGADQPSDATPPPATPDPGQGGGPGNGTEDPDPSPEVAKAPGWTPGLAWDWRVKNRLASEFQVTTVVTGASPDTYTVGFTELDPGLRSIVFHLPPVGEIDRPNLGAWWHGETVSFLDFPLEDGKTWTSTFQGTEVTYTATASRGPVLEGNGLRFAIQGVDAQGNTRVEATYAPTAGNFLRIATFFPGDTAPFTEVSLLDVTFGQAPSALVPTVSDHFDGMVNGPDPNGTGVPELQPPATFEVPESTTHLLLAVFLGGAEGHYEATFLPPGGGPINFQTNNQPGDDEVFFDLAVNTANRGQWGVQMAPGGPGFVVAEAMGVTLEETTPGSQG